MERKFLTRLCKLETELRFEYEHVLDQEELLWKQKSRSDWINEGDRNTTYFHNKFRIKRHKLQVDRLQLLDGSWCSDSECIQTEVVKFYSALYIEDRRVAPMYPIRGKF